MPRNSLFTILFIICLFTLPILGISQPNEKTKSPIIEELVDSNKAFEFFTNFENVLMIRPSLLKTIFFGVVDLKDNRKISKKQLGSNIFDCKNLGRHISNCSIDKLKLLRSKNKITNSFKIPVNFSSMKIKKINKKQSLLTFYWKPVLFSPPMVETDYFFEYIKASTDSPKYSLKLGISKIQLTTNFYSSIKIIADNKMVSVLKKLYKNPPKDFKDQIDFTYHKARMAKDFGIFTLNIFMKPKKIKVNHLWFNVSSFN